MRHILLAVLAVGLLLAVGPSGATGQVKARPKFEPTDKEKELLKLINEARANAKVLPLRFAPVLTQVARQHSARMAKQSKLLTDVNGKTLAQCAKEAGYVFHKVNHKLSFIDTRGGREVSLPALVKSWAGSKTAGNNVLGRVFLEVGLGMEEGPNGIYFTMLFGNPRID